MTIRYRTPVASGDPNLGDLFPTLLPEPERMVYDEVEAAVSWSIPFPEDADTPWVTLPRDFNVPPMVSLYQDEQRGGTIRVVRGWPTYPGQVPMIGVALGTEQEDDANESEQGGFAGEAEAHDDQGNLIATAMYWSEPLYATVIVELIHENRDERDRLHAHLRRVLFPLRRRLTSRSNLIRRVRVDSEKHESAVEVGEKPLIIFASVFTVHVYFEMLEATDVTDLGGQIDAVDVVTEPITLDNLSPAEREDFQIEVTNPQ